MSYWPVLALLTACCETGRDLATRSLLRRSGWPTNLVMGLSCLVSALLTLPFLRLMVQPSDLPQLLLALAASGLVNAVAFWAYGRALAAGELSLVLPLINLSPLVLLFSGWWLLGERPTLSSSAGVALLVLGALLLGRGTAAGSSLVQSPGARPMLLVAVLWGVAASFDKLGVQASGSLAWVALFNLAVALPLLTPAVFQAQANGSLSTAGTWRQALASKHCWQLLALLLVCGLMGAVGMVSQMEALRFTAVVHVIAIKRLSTLLSAIAGVVWLGEPRGALRLPGATLMLAGAVSLLAIGIRQPIQ
ncbi:MULTISPECIES: EamA family transporter [Synechococcaceae]|uniref:EamA family transporter n=1 Tax=Synechococcaceae TaxID=1890426 RepID=UPI0008FF5352|nr:MULTISPECIES: EamA family transporter [Synechococcaceae]APD47459.1 hypothetical protein BM449_03110 [Synechococcus sp. SynAce01]MCT4365527.1 EamA family transporter [Candidatus Regnicoccus frigidus MAG-AL1]TWB96534.1 putative membrane protein [Synechococcus sp. Ace-Pa]MCT0247239.1 EamA family transporter [Synechococcus sp. CS-601]MCT4368126.1 EamA family transporter [Candidatus Regnicoccus frigidus MAG-AL2]